MKKLYANFVSILFAVLCLVFTACSQSITAGKGTGTVRVVVGGGAARSVDSVSGLPVFDETNTKITVTGEDGTVWKKAAPIPVELQIPAGTKITVEVIVTTAAGEWRGSAVHTVTEGDNPVAVKLSKTPKSVRNILSSVISQTPYGDAKVTLKLASGKELLTDVNIGSNYIIPVTARDGNGRIYALYDKGGSRHFSRFDAEGNEDAGFETAIQGILPSSLGRIKTMTVDPKTGTLFVAVFTTQTDIYAVTETSHNAFTRSNSVDLATLPDIETNDTLTAVAAYNGELFLTVQRNRSPSLAKPNKLFACIAALSGTALTLTEKNAAELDELNTSAVIHVPTQCTGLFADASGVYCLLQEKYRYNGMLYMAGALACYSRDDNTVTYLKKPPKAGTADAYLPFDSDAFANPIGFIGSDEDYIYIADDGINIEYLNENWRINGNKNRIAAFNRKTKEITFSNTEATWYAEKPGYKFPETPVLLWEKDSSGAVRYWVSTDGTSSAPAEATKIFQTTVPTNKITDIFCYDQEGNLYILWKESTVYCVTRFELKNGTYDFTQGQQLNLGISDEVVAIATDVSDGQKFLYCAAKKPSTTYEIKQWQWDSTFTGAPSTAYNITLPSGKTVTTLVANKDGVFVATKEQAGLFAPYTLNIWKYRKDTGVADGNIVIVNNASPFDSHSSHAPYNDYDEIVHDLQIVNGVLYAVTSKQEKGMKEKGSDYCIDSFKHSNVLYKVHETDTFSGNAVALVTKNAVASTTEDSNKGVSYGFYRFIAVKPKKLAIASDSAWGKNGISTHVEANNNKVFEYDLDKNLLAEKGNAGGTFSRELSPTLTCGFEWK
ncbi:hypothetical protein [Treponema sp.]|uniref:hypothetical protein n=1 Tax=Treponema sp. TaxID=166 RepID=UPI003FA1B4E4